MPKFYSQVDLNSIPIKGLVPETASAAPSSPVDGRVYYDTVLQKAMVREAGAWLQITANTTYTLGTAAQIATGTDTTSQVWRAIDLKTAIVANAPVASVAGRTGVVVLTKTDVGLSAVDNTSDTGKPVSTAQQTALNLKANSASPTFTGSVTVPAPTVGTDAANKDYVDVLAQGLKGKPSARMATTANVALTGLQTIDGVVGAGGDRVLVRTNTASAENGIWVMVPGAWTRATDINSWSELIAAFVFIEEGATLGDTGWLSTVNSGGTIGTTAVTWVQFSSAGVVTASTGLTKVGNDIQVANLGVLTAMIADANITAAKMAANSVATANLVDASVTTAKLGTDSVTTTKIVDANVTASKLAASAVALGTSVVTGTLPLAKGGTGVTTLADLRSALQLLDTSSMFIPALTAGVWTKVYDNPGTSLDIISSTVTEVATSEIVYLDVRVNGGDVEVRSNIAVAASALVIAITYNAS